MGGLIVERSINAGKSTSDFHAGEPTRTATKSGRFKRRIKMGKDFLILSRRGSGVYGKVWDRVQSDDCVDMAAQMSFFFSLSLVPFCLALAVVIGWLPSTALWRAFATWIVSYLPSRSQHLIFTTILGLADYSAGFLCFGLIMAVWSASSGFVSLMESLSVVYCGRETRSYLRKHVVATCVTVIAMAFALASFGLMAFGRWGSHWFSILRMGRWHIPRLALQAGGWFFSVVLLCLAIDIVYFALPDAKRRWRWLTPGTAFVVITFFALSNGFNTYFQHFSSYPRIYGALAGFIILMLWIYIACLIILIGAETDHVIEGLVQEAVTR